jgi:hypothetical protein
MGCGTNITLSGSTGYGTTIPATVEDVAIEDQWANTWNGEQFLSYQNNDWGILVFATEGNYRKLQRCRTIYVDGTFRTCPTPYGMYNEGRVLPFVMCLLNGKRVGQYREFLRFLKLDVRRITGHRFRPQLVIMRLRVCTDLGLRDRAASSTNLGVLLPFLPESLEEDPSSRTRS